MTADRVDAAEVLRSLADENGITWGGRVGEPGASVDDRRIAALMAYGNGGPVVLLPDGSVKGLVAATKGGIQLAYFDPNVTYPLYRLTDPTPPSEQGGE